MTFEAHYTWTKIWNFIITLCNYAYMRSAKLFKVAGDVHEEWEIKLVLHLFFNFAWCRIQCFTMMKVSFCFQMEAEAQQHYCVYIAAFFWAIKTLWRYSIIFIMEGISGIEPYIFHTKQAGGFTLAINNSIIIICTVIFPKCDSKWTESEWAWD